MAANPLTFPLVMPLLPIIAPIVLLNNLLSQSLISLQSQPTPGFLTTLKLDGTSPTSYTIQGQITLTGIGWPNAGSGSGIFVIINPNGSTGGSINLTSNGGLIPFNIQLQSGTILQVQLTTDFPSGTFLTVYGQ
jgi:hypothetical protein